jgi:hypothetical protein
MIFCHGCGKQIHESAPTCPQCGAVQPAAQGPQIVQRTNSVSGLWVPGISITLGAVTLITVLGDSTLDEDTLVGLGIFSFVGIVLGFIGLGIGRSYRNLAVAGLLVSALALLCTLGSAT